MQHNRPRQFELPRHALAAAAASCLAACVALTLAFGCGGRGPTAASDGVAARGRFAYASYSWPAPLGIVAYAIDPSSGALRAISPQPTESGGDSPMGLVVHPSGRYLFVANAGSDNVGVLELNPETGALIALRGVVPVGDNPNFLAIAPSGSPLLVSNAGSDYVSVLAVDSDTGALRPSAGGPLLLGTDQRPAEIVISPSGRHAYVASNGMSGGAELYAFAIETNSGSIAELAESPYRIGRSSMSLAITPGGSLLYVTDPFSQEWTTTALHTFAVDTASGALAELAGSPLRVGHNAWAIRVCPSGRFLFASNFGPNADDVLAFAIDAATGALTQVPGSPFPTGDNPVRLEVHPSGEFLYVINSGAIWAYRVDRASGALRDVPGSPFPPWAWGIALSP